MMILFVDTVDSAAFTFGGFNILTLLCCTFYTDPTGSAVYEAGYSKEG